MTATTVDRNTPHKDGELISVPMAATAVIPAGVIVCANASGYAVNGSTATTLTYIGRSEESVDNSAGSNGTKSILVRRRKAFKFANDGTDPVLPARLFKACYIVDNQTVANTDGTGTRSAAGVVIAIESDGVWVQ